MLEVRFTAEMLPIGVLYTAPDQRFIRQGKGMLQISKPAISRGGVAGRQVLEGKNPAHWAPCVRIVVASIFWRIIRFGETHYAHNTFTRIQRAST